MEPIALPFGSGSPFVFLLPKNFGQLLWIGFEVQTEKLDSSFTQEVGELEDTPAGTPKPRESLPTPAPLLLALEIQESQRGQPWLLLQPQWISC